MRNHFYEREDDPVEIICKCQTCKGNAAKLGKSVLGATIPPALERFASTAKGRHGFVYMANDPNKVTGEAARLRTGIRPL